jgi:hypothetical protein
MPEGICLVSFNQELSIVCVTEAGNAVQEAMRVSRAASFGNGECLNAGVSYAHVEERTPRHALHRVRWRGLQQQSGRPSLL